MATGVLSNRITDPSGTALSGVVVNARLKPRGGFRTDTSYEVSNLESTTTDSNGDWSLTLEYNSNITPDGTYWEVEELIPDSAGGPQTWACQVAAATQTLYAALISAPPDVGTPAYLTQASADARYQALGSFGGGAQIVNTSTAAGTSTSALRGDAQFALSPNVAGTGLHLASGALDVGAGPGVYAVGTNSIGVRVEGFLTSTASVVITPGYRVPAAQTATPTTVSPAANDVWVGDGKPKIFYGGTWYQMTPVAAVTTVTATVTVTTYAQANNVPGPAVTVRTGTSAIVTIGAWTSSAAAAGGGANLMSFTVTGATSAAASDIRGWQYISIGANQLLYQGRRFLVTGLTAGENTFTAVYRVTANTGSYSMRDIVVEPLPT